MARILFIAPSSYPLNGPEAYVNAKVIKTLSEAGHVIDIVSLKSKRRDRAYPPEEDDFYFSKVNSINIVKINTGRNISTIINHIGCYLRTGFVYRGSDWVNLAIPKCEELIKKNDYDFIYTYDYPSEIVGLYLTKKYGIKWVATWNDPYTMEKYPEPYGHGINAELQKNRLKLIKEIGKYTFRNVFPNERLKEYMLKYMTNMKSETCVISPHIVLDQKKSVSTQKYGDTIKIIHSGSIGKERDPKNFFIALHNVIKNNSEINFDVTFLGINDRGKPEYVNGLIQKYNLEKVIKFHPPIPYSESLNFIKDYDICMIIEAPCKEGIFLPSKVADYIQSSKPIFTLSPSIGILNDLFNKGIISYFADISSVQSIKNTLNQIIDDYKEHNLNEIPNSISEFTGNSILKTHSKFIEQNIN